MECERFKKLLKSWYAQVQNEALAPARMVDFMENHISECPTCIMDPEAKKDMTKIITLVLPQDKLKPPARSERAADEDEDAEGDRDTELDENEDEDSKDDSELDDDDPDLDDDDI